MPVVDLSPIGNGAQYLGTSLVLLSGGLLYTYQAGTNTPLATYTTKDGDIANSNPIVLDSSGRPPQEIWLIRGDGYKFVLADSLNNIIATYDDILGIDSTLREDLAGPNGADLIGIYGETLTEFLKDNNALVVNSIDEIRNVDHTRFNRILCYGYNAVGDGGAKLYWYDPADTTTPDNAGSVLVATDGARWKIAAAGGVNVVTGATVLTPKSANGIVVTNLTANATITLPIASSFRAGTTLTIANDSAFVATIVRSGTDVILCGSTPLTTINMGNGDTLQLISNGISSWQCVGGSAMLRYTAAFAQSTGFNSYVTIAGVKIIQQGRAGVNANSSMDITYPVAYPSGQADAIVAVINGQDTTSRQGAISAFSLSATQTRITNATNINQSVFWIAIGT